VPDGKNGKTRNGDAVIREDFFCESFVVRDRQPSGVTAGIGLLQQFKVANDVLVEESLSLEVVEMTSYSVLQRCFSFSTPSGIVSGGMSS
jgi:hypothetical protein